MGSEGRIWRKSSKTPVFLGIMEVATNLHYSNNQRLSSEFQCPEQTAATQAQNSPPHRKSSRAPAGISYDHRQQHPVSVVPTGILQTSPRLRKIQGAVDHFPRTTPVEAGQGF